MNFESLRLRFILEIKLCLYNRSAVRYTSYILTSLIFFSLFSCRQKELFIKPDNDNLTYIGRVDFTNPERPVFMYSGVTIRTIFDGSSVSVILKDDSAKNRFKVTIDSVSHIFHTVKGDSVYLLADGLKSSVHFLEITRITEWHGGNTVFLGLKIKGRGLEYVPLHDRKIEFIGNSITCGYGTDVKSADEHFSYETENCLHTFAAYTAKNLKADFIMNCRSGIGMYQSYGGDTAFAMPKLYEQVVAGSRNRWDYSRFIPDVVVIELGANDLSSDVDSTKFIHAYTGFIKQLRDHYAHSKIVCLSGPANPGDTMRIRHWVNYVKGAVTEASKKYRDVYYYGLEPMKLNGGDGHPSSAEHKILSVGLTAYLRDLMNWKK